VQAVDPGRKLRPACRGVARVSVLRTQRGCLRWQGSAPCKLRFGAFGPRLAEHLKTPEASFIECPHIGRIAVIELLKNVMHRYAPVIQLRNWRRRRALSNHFMQRKHKLEPQRLLRVAFLEQVAAIFDRRRADCRAL
jgi:hypothetical protein